MGLSESLEGIWGEMHFYATIGERPFAEIMIEDRDITIRIVSFKVLLEAMLIHIFKKERISSNKLKELKNAGYTLTVVIGPIKKEL